MYMKICVLKLLNYIFNKLIEFRKGQKDWQWID